MTKHKLYTKVLYTVFALALVAGLTLVPAVAADTPADTDVGYSLAEPTTDSPATWVGVGEVGISDDPYSGSYSVKLVHDNDDNQDDLHVEFIPAAGTTLSDLDDATGGDFGFWYYLTETTVSSNGPALELKFEDPDSTDFAEVTLMLQSGPDTVLDAWTEVDLDTNFGNVGTWDGSTSTDYTTLAAAVSGVLSAMLDYELTRVQVELYVPDVQERTAYIDDITIAGTTYELEPIFLDEEYYSVGDTVEVTVPNFAANTDSVRINPVEANYDVDEVLEENWKVTAKSSSDPLTEITVALEETGADTGVFTCSIGTSGTPPVAEDELYVEDGSTITVEYTTSTPFWGAGDDSASPTSIDAWVDDTVPTITVVSPLDDAMTEDPTPVIKATYSGGTSGIDEDSVEMLVDGVDVTDDASSLTDSAVTYTPEDDLAEGTHDVTVSVSDNAGNEATESWPFRVVSWLEADSVTCDDELNELDALETVGVAVSITGDDASITVGRYASNPEPDADAPSNLIEDGFFDVQVTACPDGGLLVATQIVIKFADANITAESTAYVFDDLQGMWLACSDQGYNPTDEFLWVKVRAADTTPNISELGGTPFAISGVSEVTKGDFDDDNDIDLTDFVYFAEAYGSELGDDNYNAIGDFDDDGDIDLLDFVQFATVFGTSW